MDANRYPLDYDALKDFCERQGLAIFVNEELKQLAIPLPDRDGFALRLVPRTDRGMLTVAFPLPGTIPEDRLEELARAANLLNSRTFLGAWVVNAESQEMYFRQTVHTEGVLYTDHAVRELLQTVIGTADGLVGRLDLVLKGAPAEALFEAEA